MKILILLESMQQGGAESTSIELSKAFSNAGHEVTLAATSGPLRHAVAQNVEFREIKSRRLPFLLLGLMKAIWTIKPDVIHAQGASVAVIAKIATIPMRNRPVIILNRHRSLFDRIKGKWLFRRLLSWALDGLVASTHEAEDESG